MYLVEVYLIKKYTYKNTFMSICKFNLNLLLNLTSPQLALVTHIINNMRALKAYRTKHLILVGLPLSTLYTTETRFEVRNQPISQIPWSC